MTNLKATKKALISSVLALVMCFTMLLGTTFAWFTDSVTSAGNIIQSGNLDAEMYWAKGVETPDDNANWQDASKSAIFDYALWEPGYIDAKHIQIKNVGSLAFNYQLRIVANGTVGKLADVIDVYYFEDATKAVTRADLNGKTPLGTLAEIMGTGKNISDEVNGMLAAKGTTAEDANGNTVTDIETLTLALKMRESAGNEYQNLSIGTDFSVQLIATQATVEFDSFGKDYDANVPGAETPAALVRPIYKDQVIKNSDGDIVVDKDLAIKNTTSSSWTNVKETNLNLAAGYQFLPTESSTDGANSAYANWHADYVVTADKAVAPNTLALAGYYDVFGIFLGDASWVCITNDDTQGTIAVGQEIRLVESLGKTVNYSEICAFGNDGIGFLCGLAALDEDAVAGTTVTVELIAYETYPDGHTEHNDGTPCTLNSTNCETGVKKVLGTFKYTFPKVVKDEAGLANALAEGGTINLAAGTYKMPSNQGSTSTLNIVGTEDTVIDVTMGAYMDSAKVTFEGVTIKTGTGYANGNGSDYAALYTPNVTYINCTFVGPMRVGRDGAKFINCTFNSLGNDYVWTYGNDVTFEGCTFNSDGKAILIYSDGGDEVSKVTVKDCVFNATQGAKAGAISNQNCAAIEIHNHGNGVDLVTEGNTYDSNFFSGEWRIKTYVSGGDDIIVNGVEYTTEALDGKLMTVTGGVATFN